jgi:hypothetical protein
MNGPDLFTVAAASATRSPTSTTRAVRGKRTVIMFTVYDADGSTRTIIPAGRDGWALAELILAGAQGCTPIDQPGPRWSHYVWKLRTVHRLEVETITEQHGGEYAGHHARYVLRQRVEFADPADRARAGSAP